MTTIEWTDETWNPVVGCSKVSPGCAHCYAEQVHRTRLSGKHGYPEYQPWTPQNAAHNVTTMPHKLDQPIRWKRPRMIFVNSMSDMFHELLPWQYVADVFAVMSIATQHTFQVLTKRPERMATMLSAPMFWLHVNAARMGRGVSVLPGGMTGFADQSEAFPLPHVWLGTSIENRRFVDRADHLRATPARIRFISAEPLLGPLIPDDWTGNRGDWLRPRVRVWADDYDGPGLNLDLIDWLIVGGESGPKHRPMDHQWVRALRDACRYGGRNHDGDWGGTAFFVKQLGGFRPGDRLEDLPEEFQIREYPEVTT